MTAVLQHGVGWMMDSGCSPHMCSDHKLFRPGTSCADNSTVHCANGSVVKATSKGIVDLVLGGGKIIVLEDVLCVQDLAQNLISVSYLQKRGYSVLF